MIAEQQRAKSEIEAALTIAAARPRDQAASLDRILTSCQRLGVAQDSQYQYARGGADICGPNIRLMEVIAQQWGNIEFGFRELARFPGQNGQPGESVVEAFSWDLETNTRRRTQFTVSHSERTKKGLKIFTDPRDIYEWVANQAQRRVRTCLENIIPRDIQDAACEECDATLKAKVPVTPDLLKKLVAEFAKFGVTKDALEARIQRRLDTVTAAQVVSLRKIYASIRDGLSQAGDWFPAPEPPKSAIDDAKDKMRKTAKEEPPQEADPAPEPERVIPSDPPAEANTEEDADVALWIEELQQVFEVRKVNAAITTIPASASKESAKRMRDAAKARIKELEAQEQ